MRKSDGALGIKDVVKQVAESTDVSQRKAYKAILAAIEVIRKATLEDGKKVVFNGFGVFSAKKVNINKASAFKTDKEYIGLSFKRSGSARKEAE